VARSTICKNHHRPRHSPLGKLVRHHRQSAGQEKSSLGFRHPVCGRGQTALRSESFPPLIHARFLERFREKPDAGPALEARFLRRSAVGARKFRGAARARADGSERRQPRFTTFPAAPLSPRRRKESQCPRLSACRRTPQQHSFRLSGSGSPALDTRNAIHNLHYPLAGLASLASRHSGCFPATGASLRVWSLSRVLARLAENRVHGA